MPTITKWFFTLLFGWVLGWYSHQHWLAQETSIGSGNPTIENRSTALEKSNLGVPKQSHKALGEDSTPLNKLATLLASNQFDEAVAHFSAPSSLRDEAIRQQHRTQIIQHANTLKQRQNYKAAVQLLSSYLRLEYRDVEALTLLADVHHLQKRYRAELEVLYEAKAHAYRRGEFEQISTRIHSVAETYASLLISRGNDHELLRLYEFLTLIEPDYSPYFLGMAEAQIALQDFNGAQHSLSLIIYDPHLGEKAIHLLDDITEANEDHVAPEENTSIAIPLTRLNDQFLVEAWIDNRIPVTLLIDTGASLTVLKPSVLENAGVKYNKHHSPMLFNTANGQITAPVFTIDGLTLGDQTVRHLKVGGMQLSSTPGIDGLLGMNYLRHYQFYIDQFENVLRLTPRS